MLRSIEQQFFDKQSRKLLDALGNRVIDEQLEEYIRLCKPSEVRILGEEKEDLKHVREMVIRRGEESRLLIKGHRIHFDGQNDLARDTASTKILTPSSIKLSRSANTLDRDSGLREIFGLLDGAMSGRTMFVKFYCLGPTKSRFSINAMQVTDSLYVLHSEDILYRQGYEQFKKLKGKKKDSFLTFLHSAGELDARGVSKNYDKRRIYVDIMDGKVYSVNNQYAGNSVGLKKHALRLAIYRANHEDWLAEHMLIMGVRSPRKGVDRVSYFTGAYPSACGKTSTAMIPGETIVGDDIAYIRPDEYGVKCRAVNIEQGIFGIIQDVNPTDDPLIYKALTTPRELIFSNLLVAGGVPYWLGMGRDDIPSKGENFSGSWEIGKKDSSGKEIPFAHPNGRYTMRLRELENVDPAFEDPEGVSVEGILYGGRDSDTNVPILEALNWSHGVFLGAILESETTSATLGQQGIRKNDPMANADFVTVPMGVYIANHIKFGKNLKQPPRIFGINYFLKDQNTGRYLNSKMDKKVWILWAEGRVHGDYGAIKTPIGYIPKYEDLKALFENELSGKVYRESEYVAQFSVRIENYLAKLSRIVGLYKEEPNMPKEFWKILNEVKKNLEELEEQAGQKALPPSYFDS